MKIHININVMDYPRIISEAYDKVIEEVFKQVISNKLDYHDTMGWLDEWK